MPPLIRTLICLLLAGCIWLPSIHLFFRVDPNQFRGTTRISPMGEAMINRQLDLWATPELRQREIGRMRMANAEWDFMGRTFLVLALTSISLDDETRRGQTLPVIDTIITETLALEKEKGIFHFLMDYARTGPFVVQPPRSLFLDGEIALMLACRLRLATRDDFQTELNQRVALITSGMETAPLGCLESYPDECWAFCNSAALLALRMADKVNGTDHGPLFKRWIRLAGEKLLDPQTGLLVSSFTYGGRHLDGPEGSSIFFSAHCLAAIDPVFAQRQYRQARQELGRQLFGFGYSREWPVSWQGPQDIDSGAVLPILNLSPGASGFALLGASLFGDDEYLGELLTALEFGAFPIRKDGRLHYAASNSVGDAVMLYAAVCQPLIRDLAPKAAEVEEGP